MIDFIDKTTEQNGTPINRQNLMAMQGFIATEVQINSDGSIIETNSSGDTLKTTLSNGVETVVFTSGNNVITKTTSFEGNKIKEVIS